MKFSKTIFPEVFLIKPDIHKDNRGSFLIQFKNQVFKDETGININFCQDNLAYSKKGVLRGLHYQLHPYSQSKLVSVIKGKVLDVLVDIRYGSPTYGQHLSVELSEDNRLQLFIPRGFAHGYITLSENSIFHYKVDSYYQPEKECNISPSDLDLKIDWKLPKEKWIQSDKDSNQSNFKDAILFDYNIDLYE